MDRLRAMRLFLRVAETGSFAAACRDLGLSPSAGSAVVKDLEAHLGVQLIERTTRRLRLTAEGRRYREGARAILSELDELEDDIGASERRIAGRIRVQAPVGMARLVLAPALPDFLSAHPDIELEVLSRNVLPDFAAEDVDAAIFIGEVPERNLVARPLGRIPFLTTAAPAYLSRRGTPRTPEDLDGHACIGIWSAEAKQALDWRFRRDGRDHFRPVPARLRFEASDPAVAAAVSGGGILQMIGYLVAEDMAAGRLVPVLTDWLYPGATIHLVHSGHARRPRRLRVFEDFLRRTLAAFQRQWPGSGSPSGRGAE